MLGHVKNRVTVLTQRHWPPAPLGCGPAPRRRAVRRPFSRRRGSGLLEVIGASALFVISVSLLATVTTTAITSRVLLTRAATLDSAMNTALHTAATAPWDELVTNTFTPPSPLCPGDTPGSGTLARTCAVINGRTVPISWRVSARADATGADGVPQGAADSLLITARAERDDGSIAARSRTVMAPGIGYRVAPDSSTPDGVVRVQLAGSWRTLDSPVLLLKSDNTTVVAASRVGSDGGLVLRAGADACQAASPCRLGLDTGTSRGLSPTHSLDAASLFSDTGRVVLSPGRVSYASATIIRRGVLDVYVQAHNTTSNRQLARALAESASGAEQVAPVRGSVCLWLSFQDGVAEQRVPACNTAHDNRAMTFETYEPRPDSAPGVRVAVPTDREISVVTDGAGATCPVVSGQTFYTMNGSTAEWREVTTNGVCSSWTWGRPASLSVEGGSTTAFDEARVTIAGGGHTVAVASWTESDRSRPAAGAVGVADAVWSKPRSAATCPGWGSTGCAPAWLSNPNASSPEASICPTTHCNSPAPSAPYLRWVTRSSGSAAGWPYAVKTNAGETVSFSTTWFDAEGQAITITPTALPPSRQGTLKMCSPTCTSVTASSSVTVASGGVVQWQWVSSNSAAGGAVRLTTVDSTGSSRQEVIHFPRSTGTPVAATLSRGVALQNGADSLHAWVWAADGGVPSQSSLRWETCATAPQTATGVTGATGAASASWAPGASTSGTQACDVAIAVDGEEVVLQGAVEQEVRPAPSTVTPSVGASTQGQSTTVTVSVSDAAGAALVGWPVSVVARDATGESAQSVWASPSWCRTTISGSCEVLFSVGTDSDGAWSAYVRVGNVTAEETSTVTRIASHVTAGDAQVTQGSSTDIIVTVTDGAQRPLARQAITLVLPLGITAAQPTVTTGSTGRATVTLTASASAGVGTKQVLIRSQDAVSEIDVTVKPAAAVLESSAWNVELQRDQSATVRITVTSAGGERVPGALVSVTGAQGGLFVSPAGVSDETGVVVLNLYARNDARVQVVTLTVSSAGTPPITVSVVVK